VILSPRVVLRRPRTFTRFSCERLTGSPGQILIKKVLQEVRDIMASTHYERIQAHDMFWRIERNDGSALAGCVATSSRHRLGSMAEDRTCRGLLRLGNPSDAQSSRLPGTTVHRV
jgi:hypothetical protein